VGGWGDIYRSYMNFDLTGLPLDPTNVNLWLYNFTLPGTNTTPYQVCIPGSAWNTTIAWSNQPTFVACSGYFNPVVNTWNGLNITGVYQNWVSGAWGKYGLMFNPQYANNNNSLHFRSSSYRDFATDPYADGKRPILQFDFTPTLELKMPLPANYSWLVTTEAGGYDCKGGSPWPDTAHQGSKYFSIDISDKSLNYPANTDVSVLAAASGRIFIAGGGNTTGNPNGYYAIIDHDGDGDSGTGFQTWYVHLKDLPKRANGTLLSSGDYVNRGDRIGIMGNTGKDSAGNPTSFGTHLHFAVKYKNDSSSAIPELTKVTMDGKLLRSYQTECSVNSSGTPVDYIRYYTSGNIPTGF